MENQPTKLDKAIKISIMVGALLVALSIAYYFVIFLPQIKDAQLQEKKPVSETDLKKQALVEFDSKVSEAIKNKDFGVLYDLSTKTTQKYFTRDQFIKLREEETKNTLGWMNITASNIQINDELGTIDRTYYACQNSPQIRDYEKAREWLDQNPTDARAEKVKEIITQHENGTAAKGLIDGKEVECLKEGLQTRQQTVKYSYSNGQWSMNDPMPTDRALKASAFLYDNVSKERQEKAIRNLGEGSTNYLLAIRNFALALDESQESLATLEAQIEKDKINKSRPIVNVQQPDVPFPTSRLQIEAAPRHCTSSAFGSSVYTNCY